MEGKRCRKNEWWRGKIKDGEGRWWIEGIKIKEILWIKGEDEGWRNKMKEEKGKR